MTKNHWTDVEVKSVISAEDGMTTLECVSGKETLMIVKPTEVFQRVLITDLQSLVGQTISVTPHEDVNMMTNESLDTFDYN